MSVLFSVCSFLFPFASSKFPIQLLFPRMAISPRANNGLDYGFLGIMSPQSPEKVSSMYSDPVPLCICTTTYYLTYVYHVHSIALTCLFAYVRITDYGLRITRRSTQFLATQTPALPTILAPAPVPRSWGAHSQSLRLHADKVGDHTGIYN